MKTDLTVVYRYDRTRMNGKMNLMPMMKPSLR